MIFNNCFIAVLREIHEGWQFMLEDDVKNQLSLYFMNMN